MNPLGRIVAVCLVLLSLSASAGVADAAQLHVSPNGGGVDCTSGSPCGLQIGIGLAEANDEVIIAPGEYEILGGLEPGGLGGESGAANVNIHGDFAGPMPKITIQAEGTSEGLILSGPGDRLAWVELIGRGQPGEPFATLECYHGQIERVHVSLDGTQAGAAIGLVLGCELLRNSVATASGGASAIEVGTITPGVSTFPVINSTAIATGAGSVGISASWSDPTDLGPGTTRLELTNSVVRGSGADLKAISEEGSTSIVASHSNFSVVKTETGGSFTDAGGNQTSTPIFVDPLFGNLAEGPGSPTIDAGLVTAASGPVDLAGNPRSQGASTDIGAYEAPAPSVVGTISSLSISPKAFKTVNAGGALISKKGKTKAAKVGGAVSYSLTAAATVTFTVEKAAAGRRSGAKCVRQTKANKGKKKCKLYKPAKGSFTVDGTTGANSFKFSGRIGNKSLKPGKYRLVGVAGGATKRAAFSIVK